MFSWATNFCKPDAISLTSFPMLIFSQYKFYDSGCLIIQKIYFPALDNLSDSDINLGEEFGIGLFWCFSFRFFFLSFLLWLFGLLWLFSFLLFFFLFFGFLFFLFGFSLLRSWLFSFDFSLDRFGFFFGDFSRFELSTSVSFKFLN